MQGPALLNTQNDMTPINGVTLVVNSDATPLQYNGQAIPCRGLLFQNVVGNISVVMADGSAVTLASTASWFGVIYLRVAYVKATGSTYTGQLHACY
jgi:hypothetical protein